MLMKLFSKPSHQPYLALRAPAHKMIKRKHLPPIEKLQNTITSTSALVSSWAFSESGRQKAGSQIPRGPSIAEFIREVSDEIKQLQPIIKGLNTFFKPKVVKYNGYNNVPGGHEAV